MGDISVMVRSDLLIYSILLDIIILIYLKVNATKETNSAKIFKQIVIAITVVTAIETVSWLTGEIGNSAQIPIHYWSNVLFLSLIGLPAAFGLRYLDYKILGNFEKSRKRLWFYFIPTYINAGLAIYNFFDEGFLFRINDMNQYLRGLGVGLGAGALYVFFIIAVIYFYKYKQRITGRIIQSILIFFFTPILGSAMQIIAYGTTFGMPSYTLAALIVFLIIEKDEMGRDELTGLYTRSKLEALLRFKIKSREAFTVIMVDLDNFKVVNDTFGHLEGDSVLKKVAEILRLNTNIEDMVCRYGGDEFLMIIECSEDIGKRLISRINSSLAKYNLFNHNYKIHLSYGHVYVKDNSNMDVDELLHLADQKMYEDKLKRKKEQAI